MQRGSAGERLEEVEEDEVDEDEVEEVDEDEVDEDEDEADSERVRRWSTVLSTQRL